MPRLTQRELEAVLDEHWQGWRTTARIVTLGERELVMTTPFRKELLRIGGTISGPSLMTLADRAAYYLTLAIVGPVPEAVTANLSIHFLRKPSPSDITARAVMLRAGKRQTVCAIDLSASDQLVAHATVTYALPSRYGNAKSA